MKSDSSVFVRTILENEDIEDIKKRIQACCSGNISAKQQFQADFGELIYNFIRKVLKAREEKAADIYLYIFEGERLFKRLQSFRGEHISFKDYLTYKVLKQLCWEWLRKRSKESVEASSIDDPDSPILDDPKLTKLPILDNPDATISCYTLNNRGEGSVSTHEEKESVYSREETDAVYRLLETDEFLILKIYYLYELGTDLLPEDIREIANKSGKSYIEVIKKNLSQKVTRKEKLQEQRDAAYTQSLRYQRELTKTEEELIIAKNNRSSAVNALKEKRESLKRKYDWRICQINEVAEKKPDAVITTSYKDIAELMGMSVGAVSGKIARAKEKMRLLVRENKQNNLN